MTTLFPDPTAAGRRLDDYLHHSIPLVGQMEVRVVGFDGQRLQLAAPLAPNQNHIGTAFGGSLSSIATLAAWGMAWLALEGLNAEIVISEARTRFRRPVTDAFDAICSAPTALAEFRNCVMESGRGKLHLASRIECHGRTAVQFEGDFAARVRHND